MRQLIPQRTRNLRRGPVLLAQRNQDVRISRPHRRRIRIRKIQTRVGNTNVVQNRAQLRMRNLLPDHSFNLVAQASSILNARTRLRTHMEPELPPIYRRKKVLAKPRI